MGSGGKREGAGRPRNDSKLYTFRAGGEVSRLIDSQPNKTDFIISSIKQSQRGDIRLLGEMIPAMSVEEADVPFFDINLVAGFPIPLDNDEKSQDINILRLLCPHPESCYLIRVKGDSMVEANVNEGDIVIVDKSNRNPSEHEMAVCELNGEYTLKQVIRREEAMFLVPANPNYPEIEIKENDRFNVWGTVTYIIHKAKI